MLRVSGVSGNHVLAIVGIYSFGYRRSGVGSLNAIAPRHGWRSADVWMEARPMVTPAVRTPQIGVGASLSRLGQPPSVGVLVAPRGAVRLLPRTEQHSERPVTQNNRSAFRSRGQGRCRLKTVSCWRRAEFSRAISRTLPGKMRRPISEHNRANMGPA